MNSKSIINIKQDKYRENHIYAHDSKAAKGQRVDIKCIHIKEQFTLKGIILNWLLTSQVLLKTGYHYENKKATRKSSC